MKKFIFMFTIVMCICVSCGNKSNSDKSSENISETASSTELNSEVPEKVSGNDKEYDEVISNYREYMENNKLVNMMQLSYPDRYFEIFSFMAEMSGTTVDDVMGNIQDATSNTIRITEILSDEPFEDSEMLMNMLVDIYGEYQVISNYIDEQGGTQNVVEENFNEFIDTAEYDSENISLYFEPENARLIKCNMESSVAPPDEDGEPEVNAYEQDFIVYYIDGEGWKMDTYVPFSE